MTEALICDTSGILAALDRSDPAHDSALAAVANHRGLLVLSPLVLAELDFLVRARLSAVAARLLAADVAEGAYELATLTAADVARCRAVDEGYGDLGLGLTDAHLVVLAEQFGTRALLSLDERHLRAVRPLSGGAFALLPADRLP